MEQEKAPLHGAEQGQSSVILEERENTLAQPALSTKDGDGAEKGKQEPIRYVRNSVTRGIRLSKKEDDEISKLIQYAYLTKQIPKPKLANYIDFCMALGKEKLYQIYLKNHT